MTKTPPMSIDEICMYLNINRKTFFNWIEMNQPPVYRLYDFWQMNINKEEKMLEKEENKRQSR